MERTTAYEDVLRYVSTCVCSRGNSHPLLPLQLSVAGRLFPHQDMFKWLAYGNGKNCRMKRRLLIWD